MQKLQDSVFSIVKTTNLSPAVFSFLQPSDDFGDKTPLGGILQDTKYGWLALGPKFCVIDLRTGLKIAARTFGTTLSNNTIVTSVVELPTPLTPNSKQLLISLQCDDISIICVLHVNGSQILRCIQTDIVVTQLAVCDRMPDGPFANFDGVVMAGTRSGEIFVFDLNRACLIQALKDISQGYEHIIQNEANPSNLNFLPLNSINRIAEQRELAVENDHHLAILLNENSFVDNQYIFRNPDGGARMKAKRDHIRVTVLEYIPQLASLAVGFNFGAFQIWNLLNMELEYTSQVNVECLPVTHFGFQEPCDDPRAFCYLWVIFSAIDRFEEEEFPLAVMYSLTYQGKRMLSDNECLYQDFSIATIRFQVELSSVDDSPPLLGGKCIACHTYSIKSTLGDEGEDSMLNICQLVWECWGENVNESAMEYGMLLFDLDQWYKDQMPATYRVSSNAFMSAARWSGGRALHARLSAASIAVYSHATRLEEHFYPNSLQYNCICLNTSEVCVLSTQGIQRQIINSMEEIGPTVLLNPLRLYNACVACGLTPLYTDTYSSNVTQEEQRRYLLSVALEARLTRFLKRCAHDWATGTHNGIGCSLMFLVDWCWKRAMELKENAKELTAPLFVSAALPDRNVVRCLEHCVQQLTQLTGLMDAILTKCCNLVVPDALSEMEERHKGIGTVSLYFQVVQWFLRVGLLPERHEGYNALPYPAGDLYDTYNKRRMKLNRLQDNSNVDESKSCALLYIDQLIEHEFGGDRIHQMWIKGGSECSGLYPPPSLYSLLRLYLLPDIPEEHKHSLVLYLLVDYSMIYDDVRYESVIRRLMQFPTMFGLSNTAIKATQAFWHLDHRDFDFALDQLQCLTGNTLSEWQHKVVLSSLLAQKKTQAALQYLHVRKPAPIQNIKDELNPRVNDHDKLEDWQSCCNLYLARDLVYEALDVVRMCVQNTEGLNEKAEVLTFFFKGCRNTGNLSKVLQVTLQQFEEEVFIKYLENCNEPQTSDILVMYFLQQARYLEAERYNEKLKSTTRFDIGRSMESLNEANERHLARDYLVKTACAAVPKIASDVARAISLQPDIHAHVTVTAPKPMSVYVRAKSPKNQFTYKSSFIQDTIENASETWMNKPRMRKGLKRALNIEETPFICTPKLNRTRSIYTEQMQSESTPPKRAKLDFTGTPKTPKMGSSFKMSEKLSSQMEKLLDMPEVQSPVRLYTDRPGTPHSILKIRRNERDEAPSPTDSRYLGDSDDDMLETASNHTHFSDSTNKHLRFKIPRTSESGSSPSPAEQISAPAHASDRDEKSVSSRLDTGEKEMDVSTDSFATTTSHGMMEPHPLESPPKRQATEESMKSRKSYKDNVRARRSLSISANSSLSEDPNASIESIADIPITLINPRYSGEKRRSDTDTTIRESKTDNTLIGLKEKVESHLMEARRKERDSVERLEAPKTPRGRRGIRSIGESTPLASRSGSGTPDRIDSPIATPLRRISRSRSKTPEVSPRSSPLAPILELPKQEGETEPHPEKTTLSVPRQLRSRSRTPERLEKLISESPRLEAIKESPTKTSSSSSSPSRRSLRSRSRTPEVETPEPTPTPTLRALRSRSKTPEKLMSPKKEPQSIRSKKSLSRLVLEANTFKAKTTEKDEQTTDKGEQSTEKGEQTTEKSEQTIEKGETNEPENDIECTPMKTLKQVTSLMDVTLSPIVNKSVLQASTDSVSSTNETKSDTYRGLKTLPAFTLHETYFEKSVLKSYESSVGSTESIQEETRETNIVLKSLPAFTTIHEDFNKSVLNSYESSVAESSQSMVEGKGTNKNVPKSFTAFSQMIDTDFEKSVLRSHQSSIAEKSSLITNDSDDNTNGSENNEMAAQIEKEKIVEIEREINEIEDNMSNDSERSNESEEVEEEQSEESEESSSEESSANASAEDVDDEVISIEDSDSDSEGIEQIETENRQMVIENLQMGIENKQMELEKQKIEMENQQLEIENQQMEFQNQQIDIVPVQDIGNENNIQTDPLNQVSLMTDDNSAESDQEISLNYSDDKMNPETVENVAQSAEVPEKQTTVQIEVPSAEITPQIEKIVESKPSTLNVNVDTNIQNKVTESDKLNDQIMEIDEPATIIEQSSVKDDQTPKNIERKTDETKAQTDKATSKIDEPMPSKSNEPVAKVNEPEIPKVVDSSKDDKISTVEKPEVPKATAVKPVTSKTELKTKKVEKADKKEEPLPQQEKSKAILPQEEKLETMETENNEQNKVNPEMMETEPNKDDTLKPATRTRKRAASSTSTKSKDERESKTQEEELKTQEEPRTPTTRRRSQSIASNKSERESKTKEEELKTQEEPRTPTTRRRSQSIASNKSEDKTPDTPKRRGKTPELRKIITRRVSRGMSEKLDESNVSIDELPTTPKRTRSRKVDKNDDNESVASESSFISNKSSEAGPSRKGRKSTVVTKPDLSVIPEVTTEESAKETTQDLLNEYSNSRRLTRNQKALLSSLLESSPSRVRSRASRSSVVSEEEEERKPAFDVQTIDRITLLNKTDFEGSPDEEELMNTSPPESIASDASKMRRNRMSRASSETKITSEKKPAKINRRGISVDIVEAQESPASSPARGRRASFNRAIEALHTPKGRRTSTDVKQTDSPGSSPAPSESEASVNVSAARRGRRASTHSNTSLTKSESGRRSKKLPALEEVMETKK